jgi:alkylation response protein AidB-like acyl-CoA dehydrogenase
MGIAMVAPTLVDHGSPELKQRFLPGLLNGHEGWCQLFSEPGAGSDLAGLQTRAVRDGDEFVVNGQKVWTSTGQWADFGILVARTDPDVSKHRGLTFFVIDMHQPGIEVRPLRELTGDALFNEVFMEDARVPADWIVGAEGDGWRVTNTTLMHERNGMGEGSGPRYAAALTGSVAGHLDHLAGEAVDYHSVVGPTPLTYELLLELASPQTRVDPLVRQDLARLYSLDRITEWHIGRMRSGSAATGCEGNLAKLRSNQAVVLARELGGAVIGAHAIITGPDSVSGDVVQRHILFSPAPQIYGGSNEIQHNIIGERALGLPKEPDPYKDRPFRELPSNAVSY